MAYSSVCIVYGCRFLPNFMTNYGEDRYATSGATKYVSISNFVKTL